MKKLLLAFVILIFISCESSRVHGVYVYTEKPKEKNEKENLFDFGKEIACSVIGKFEFRDNNCYLNIMGTEIRTGYDIDNDVIYLKNNQFDQAGAGIRIIDENTLDYSGCTFKKVNK